MPVDGNVKTSLLTVIAEPMVALQVALVQAAVPPL